MLKIYEMLYAAIYPNKELKVVKICINNIQKYLYNIHILSAEVYDKHYGGENSGVYTLEPRGTSPHSEPEEDAAWGNYEQERSVDGAISQRDDTGDMPEILTQRNDDERRADFLGKLIGRQEF